MNHVGVPGYVEHLQLFADQANELLELGVTSIVVHHGNPDNPYGLTPIYTNMWTPVHVGTPGRWVYQFTDPTATKEAINTLQATGLKVHLYAAPREWSQLVGGNYGAELLAWHAELEHRLPGLGVYFDSLQVHHTADEWFTQIVSLWDAQTPRILHGSIDVKDGGRAYWRWANQVMIGETPLPDDEPPPGEDSKAKKMLRFYALHFPGLIVHPDVLGAGNTWDGQPFPNWMLALGINFWLHCGKEIDWLRAGLGLC